jgi:hypothetical protein
MNKTAFPLRWFRVADYPFVEQLLILAVDFAQFKGVLRHFFARCGSTKAEPFKKLALLQYLIGGFGFILRGSTPFCNSLTSNPYA